MMESSSTGNGTALTVRGILLYKMIQTQFNWLHVCSYSDMPSCLLCWFTAHHVTIYSYDYIITSYLEKYMASWVHVLHI